MDRVLLTGVTGFIGSHLGRTLVAQGTEVHALVRPGAHLERIGDLVGKVVLHTDDGTAEGLERLVKDASPEATFHLATNFVAEHVPADVAGLVHDNVATPTRLAEALARAGAPAFVNVGTAWQHVDGEPYRPKNLYAATKQAFEDILAHYVRRGELGVVTVNLYDSYGPLDHRGKLVAGLVRAARDGATLEMSSGRQLIDVVHVRDIVAALLLAGERCRSAGAPEVATFAVSSGAPLSLRDLVAVLEHVAGRPVAVRWGARPDRPGEMLQPWAAGPPLPGWKPEVALATGLAELLAEG